MDNETVIEDVSEEDYFIKVYQGDFEFGMYDWAEELKGELQEFIYN